MCQHQNRNYPFLSVALPFEYVHPIFSAFVVWHHYRASNKPYNFPTRLTTMKETLEKISTFLAWAVFTFLSHFTAKQFLSSSKHLSEAVIVLTSLQMAAGSVLYLKFIISRGGGEVNIEYSHITILSLKSRTMRESCKKY